MYIYSAVTSWIKYQTYLHRFDRELNTHVDWEMKKRAEKRTFTLSVRSRQLWCLSSEYSPPCILYIYMCNILYMYMYLYLYRNHVKELYIYPSGRHQSSCFQRRTGRRTTRSSRLSDPERRRSERQIRNPTRKSSDASIKTRCFISESTLRVVGVVLSPLDDTSAQTHEHFLYWRQNVIALYFYAVLLYM